VLVSLIVNRHEPTKWSVRFVFPLISQNVSVFTTSYYLKQIENCATSARLVPKGVCSDA
jgi:hypothetical protein